MHVNISIVDCSLTTKIDFYIKGNSEDNKKASID